MERRIAIWLAIAALAAPAAACAPLDPICNYQASAAVAGNPNMGRADADWLMLYNQCLALKGS